MTLVPLKREDLTVGLEYLQVEVNPDNADPDDAKVSVWNGKVLKAPYNIQGTLVIEVEDSVSSEHTLLQLLEMLIGKTGGIEDLTRAFNDTEENRTLLIEMFKNRDDRLGKYLELIGVSREAADARLALVRRQRGILESELYGEDTRVAANQNSLMSML